MKLRRARVSAGLLNVTPLIDVVFILLVFFMLTTNFGGFRLIGIDTPQHTEAVPDAAAGIVVKLLADGGIRYDGELASREEVAASAGAILAADPGRAFLVRPEAGVTMQEAMDMYSLIRAAGGYAVTFSPDAGEAGPEAQAPGP